MTVDDGRGVQLVGGAGRAGQLLYRNLLPTFHTGLGPVPIL